MNSYKIGLALGASLGISISEGFPLLKKHGFDATFTGVGTEEQLYEWADLAAKYGIIYSSLHAPFKKAAIMWEDGIAGDDAEQELHNSIDACTKVGAPILVVHPFIGFNAPYTPTATGLARFRRLAEYANTKGVRLAIENVEGEEYLRYLMDGLKEYPSVKFCLDSGHELCYNRGKDLLADYGDRLAYLHINSNMGVTAPDGTIGFRDDSHMLPFDGLVSMEHLAARLKKCNYDGILMMELVKGNRPDRSTNDIYNHLSPDEYIGEAANRIRKLRALME